MVEGFLELDSFSRIWVQQFFDQVFGFTADGVPTSSRKWVIAFDCVDESFFNITVCKSKLSA